MASTKIDSEEDGEEWEALAVLLGRGFSLGYSDDLVESLTYCHITLNTLPKLHRLLSQLLSHEKRTYLSSLLRILSRKHLFNPQLFQSLEDPSENPTGPDTFDAQWWKSDTPVVSQIAALLHIILGGDTTYRDLVVDWLVSSNGGGVGEPIGIRRALVAALNEDQDVLKVLLEKSMIIFGDSVWIRHTPIMRQEVNVQLLLLLSGYTHRQLPQYLNRLARSSPFLNGVSNRLAASSIRARFLGMIVGESLSGLTDKDGKPMDFGVTETASEEARWWKSIVGVQDSVGDAGEVIKLAQGGEITVRKRKQSTEVNPKIQSKVMVVEEVESEEEEEEDDEFQPYPKPDSDAEDSDEDPTLINRKKDTAPIYIRDLLLYLRSTDSYDRQLLAVQSSAALIRRKANFGKELSDHASELASLLTGLNDKFEMENFQEMRMQALIALVVSSPVLVGGLLARGFFEGDYSLGQRAAMASAIGMGARELAGCDDGDLPLSVESAKGKSTELFPSKMLPGLMHNQWIKGKTSPLDRITGGMEKMMISPMAAEAADKVTGPNILKVRTFSSRIEVEKRRVKPAENKLGKVVAEAFFFPLTGRWWGALKDFGGRGIHFEPFLLTLFLKTLSIILHATGPSAVALPQMTSELWDLLFSLRNHSFPTSNDSSVQEAVLFALLTLLEVNTSNDNGRRLADEHAKELLETQEWVSGIMESGQLGEEEKGRVLAASVIVRIRGIIDGYQRRLMGELLSLEA
ncbi:uncharacterized protein LAJ45_08739 [Morchella importuna]|uniref:uncharacterized protein n=1 Tax=Morchella importuna TaxID=1174673 RepID=UPI001E8D9512|nr:uncharacterized protein LAJ45_08739 [Morchella importuna]KAH8147261.1 hypothetical protein LAJ45_08739 [Morchella importuna]